jgi:multidrug efflux pump subunit AcrB
MFLSWKKQKVFVSVIDIAQTLQLSLSGQRFGYFMKKGKQYQVIGQFDQKTVLNRWFNLYVREKQ